MILCLDPGTEKTGYAVMNQKKVVAHGVVDNLEMARIMKNEFRHCNKMVYEMVSSFGMPVGKEVFETCVWIGRFIETFGADRSTPIFRKDVKMHLCGSPRARDANVRQAILDLYKSTGGGKTPQIGTIKQPGPLFGVNSHIWPAIGVGLTYQGISA
jgi:hypothetical protein